MTIKLLLLKSGEDVIADVTEMAAGDEKRVVNTLLINLSRTFYLEIFLTRMMFWNYFT